MAVYLPCYCTREDVKAATDIESTAQYDAYVDAAIQTATDGITDLCHRRFYNIIQTNYFDWPNYQYAYPWRIWFDASELADVTVNVPVVTSGGVVIPSTAIFWGPWNYGPPYDYMELDRSQSYAFGVGPTPQRDVTVKGTFGYWTQTKAAGTLASAISSTSAATATVSNSALMGVGDTITIDSESMLVSDRTWSDTGQAQIGSGCSTALASDNVLQVSSGAAINVGEKLQLDAETVLATSITGNNVTVQRAYDGTLLATHSGAEVFAQRLLTVLRGQFGTTAATHLISAPISASLVPGQVHALAVAESLNTLLQQTSGYARSIGENATPAPGGSLLDLRNFVVESYGRKSRQRVV